METIESLIETYESQYINEIVGNSIDALNVLMDEQGLKQSDLPEIGCQAVVSEILSGRGISGTGIDIIEKNLPNKMIEQMPETGAIWNLLPFM